jgi:hypothetical protein
MMRMVRNPAGQHADDLLQKNVIGIGCGEVARHITEAKVPEDYYDAVRTIHPEYRPRAVINAGSKLYKFFHEMKVGDVVATYGSPQRVYHVGVITGGAQINPDTTTDCLVCTRPVDWKHQVERDLLSPAAQRSLGSTFTIFKPSEDAQAELWKLIKEPKATREPQGIGSVAVAEGARRVRVFVSSPGDARFERARLERVIERLNGEFQDTAQLSAIRWETEFYKAHKTFQAQIPEAAQCDIVVAIFRSRLGTELPPDFPRMENGEPYPSGTAYEVLTAIAAARDHGFPDVYVFRYPQPPSVQLDDPKRAEIEAQWERLKGFFETWFRTQAGHFKAAFQPFASTDDFEAQAEAAAQMAGREGAARPRGCVAVRDQGLAISRPGRLRRQARAGFLRTEPRY